tara:strand:- start:221 stop:442 length:222 start_codon:yes stop_codon:yes gene_type:complete
MDISIGSRVFLKAPLPYLKTNDPMPMLRPPDLVSINEIGEIVGLRPIDNAEVRFRRGVFIIPLEKLTLETSKN